MGSSIDIIKNKAKDIISNSGRAALHAMAPNDFEYYACSLELLKSNGDIEQIFHFPVMPVGISVDDQPLVNIRKTGNSFGVQFSDSYVPKNITINGTFGRKFRLLLSDNSGDDINLQNIGKIANNFDLKVKTGYGMTKTFEQILSDLYQLDEFNSPRFLIFHNFAFNQSTLVEVVSKSFTQSNENNMMWNYSIQMKGIADASKLVIDRNNKRHLKDLLVVSSLQRGANVLFDNINLQSLKDLAIF